MTRDQAIQVKMWRMKGATWRKIADLAAKEWPDEGYDAGNQIEGRCICDEARSILNETNHDGWN